MDWKKYVREHLAPLKLDHPREMEMVDELSQHLESIYEDALSNGSSEHDAFNIASAHVKDWNLLECELNRARRPQAPSWINQPLAESNSGPRSISLGSFAQDIRYAVRMLINNKGFASVAVLSLALGIGANTAIFSLINAVMLRMLPVNDPQQLVLLKLVGPGRISNNFNYRLFEELQQDNQSFNGLIAANTVTGLRITVIDSSASSEVETVQQAQVSSNFFSVFGVNAVIGRLLSSEDDRNAETNPVAVISYDFWKRRFGLDPAVVGKQVALNDAIFTIVGVTPQGFVGFEVGRKPDLWWPLRAVPLVFPGNQSLSNRGHWWLRVIGRLQPDANLVQAGQELDGILKQHTAQVIADEPPRSESYLHYLKEVTLEIEPGATGWSTLRSDFKQPLYILMAAVGLVLLTACANVANLLLARAIGRRKEIAIRLAIGAGRWRIVRQLLTESILMSILSGALGLLLAQIGAKFMITYLPAAQTAGLIIEPDRKVLGFTLGLSLLTGILFGLAPALQSTRFDLINSLKNLASAGSRSRFGLTSALVVVQVALSLLLLIGAGLFVRTLQNLRTVDAGFDRENLISFRVDAAARLELTRRVSLYKEIIEKLEALPGTRSASLASFPLLGSGAITNRVTRAGGQPLAGEDAVCHQLWAGPRFIETLRIPLLSGRDFTKRDERQPNQQPANADIKPTASKPVQPVSAIINQSMARQFFPDEDPIGKLFHYEGVTTDGNVFEVIGVVKDAKYENLRESPPKTFYSSYFQSPSNFDQTFELRTFGDVAGIGLVIEHAVQEINPKLRIVGLQTMNEIVDRALIQERFIAKIAGFFSLFALLLASIGLYGLMSHNVTRRKNEIGIRMALGAQRRDIVLMILRQTMILVVLGSIIGLGAAIVATRLISSWLYGLTPSDPLTIGVGVILMSGVAALAGYLPARRGASVDPMTALRCE